MDNNEQRDFEEEEYNRALMEEQDFDIDIALTDDQYVESVLSDIPDWMLA